MRRTIEQARFFLGRPAAFDLGQRLRDVKLRDVIGFVFEQVDKRAEVLWKFVKTDQSDFFPADGRTCGDAVGGFRAVSEDEVNETVVAANDLMGLVIVAGEKFRAEASFVDQAGRGLHIFGKRTRDCRIVWDLRSASFRVVAFVKLQAIAADGEKFITVNQNALRTAPAEIARDDFEGIVNAVVVFVVETADGVAIADQETAFAIEGERVAAAGKFGGGGTIDVEAGRKFELVVEQFGIGGDEEREKGQGKNMKSSFHGGERVEKFLDVFQIKKTGWKLEDGRWGRWDQWEEGEK